MRRDLMETNKPLSPEQAQRRAERDQKRQARIREIEAKARARVTTIRGEIGR
jgi:hypothetical protein